MLYFSLPVFSFALVAIAQPLQSIEGLSVELTVENDKVASVQDVALKATVTNTGSNQVRILKYNTILDELPTRSFVVTKDGEEVPFQGIHMQIDVDQVTEEGYAVIPAGESLTVTHKVAELYDFESMGVGSFKFTTLTELSLAEHFEDENITTTFAAYDAPSSSVEVQIMDSVVASRIHKRAVVKCADPAKAAFIRASYYEAKELALLSEHFASHYTTSTLYRAYWGWNEGKKVAAVFRAVVAENNRIRQMGCVDSVGGCKSGVIAYTFTARPQNIVYCPIFFKELATYHLCLSTTVNARNIRGGTALHELTHALYGTDDHGYGCEANKKLSEAKQISNADNYNCFATQVYKNIYCP